MKKMRTFIILCSLFLLSACGGVGYHKSYIISHSDSLEDASTPEE